MNQNPEKTTLPGAAGARLDYLRAQIGYLTIDEVLQLAIEAEQFAKDCGPLDIAYAMFRDQYRGMFEYAELLEKESAFVLSTTK